MIKAIIFDLDDTLYPDMQFVKSGFKTVSGYVARKYKFSQSKVFKELVAILKSQGRSQVFDLWLKKHSLYNRQNVKQLVYIYRAHQPKLKLTNSILNVLKKLKKQYKLGLISDGLSSVQRNKIKVLNLSKYFNCIIVTDEIPGNSAKPSTVPYKLALDLLEVSPQEACYVGNDLKKDFIGSNKLGMMSILSKQYTKTDEKMKYTINNLSQLGILINKLNNV